MRQTRTLALTLLTLVFGWLSGCGDDEAPPASDPLETPEASPTARTFTIDTASSDVDFVMVAPLENIHGVAPGSMAGDLYIDLEDIGRSRALVKIDLNQLELFQQKRESADADLGEETKSETQNEHARTWLQISPDTPEEVREANRFIQYAVTRVSDPSATNVLEMDGAERTVTLTTHGDFRLHGHTVEKTARLELTFAFEGDEPRSVRVRTAEPVPVNLAEHDIRPRSAFDQLAQATLSSLGEKVAEAAPITFELTADVGEPLEEMPDCAVEGNEAAEAACDLGVEGEPGQGGLPSDD